MNDSLDTCGLERQRRISSDSARADAMTRRSDLCSGRFELNPLHVLAAWLAGSMLAALLILGLAAAAALALRHFR